jgi:threonine aldolase
VGNIYVKQIENLNDGTFDLEKLETMIYDHADRCCSRTRVVCIENTHNWCGGRIVPVEWIERLHSICKKRDIRIHMDGSRIMNASVAANLDVKVYSRLCDSVNFCFSKVAQPN